MYVCCGRTGFENPISNRQIAYHCLSVCLRDPKCKIHVSVFIFNLVCTYHAASPPGSEQERLEYALNSKRRALILALRWAKTHTYLLQEEPSAISFLEVTKSKLLNAVNDITYTDPMHGLSVVLPLCLCRSCMGAYQMILGC